MISFFHFFCYLLRPYKCCKNCEDPGRKRAKRLILCPAAKNGPSLRRDISPLTLSLSILLASIILNITNNWVLEFQYQSIDKGRIRLSFFIFLATFWDPINAVKIVKILAEKGQNVSYYVQRPKMGPVWEGIFPLWLSLSLSYWPLLS